MSIWISVTKYCLFSSKNEYKTISLKLGTNYWPDVTIDRIKEEIKKKK